ncbi:NAD-dependent deacylase [Phaeobacter sp. QD34_3]|uniref:NAD-dependent deacylase n=1 Tax=unclassified Phaeobacter TaxID=2621772 RepID=UPI00237F3C41|nr:MULTISPECIES: NAD-dependent deacylase [unclassified Phaeobacter]MDE4133695.1 NAD-dependent deacylase [Phaeobacter sp. QD34_3]MDE4137372.1 NAD-dependent deacylase [Phaeobacter sp. QD34_24]
MGKSSDKIVILTGAGISAESGLGTFRDEGGLWAEHRIEDVATPEGFARNPELVHQFYNARRAQAATAEPNAAHIALADLQKSWPGDVVIITQNVDGLHEKGGASKVLHMHGVLDGALCARCEHRWPAPLEMHPSDTCPACQMPSTRPDIVWFGEMPYDMEEIYDNLGDADVFASIGTSGQVYPAAAFVQEAKMAGAHTIELNLEPSAGASSFVETRLGPATQIVPLWTAELLAQA